MPRQQLPSIQEIFGETHPLAISTGQSYAWSADTRHAAPPASPAMYGIEHSNEEAPSNEQGLFFKISTVRRSLGIAPPTNVLKHSEVNHPKRHSRSSHFSRTFSRRLSVENSTSSSVSSQEASVPRHQFCYPKILLPSTSPNDCSLNEPYNFSTHPIRTYLYLNPVQYHAVPWIQHSRPLPNLQICPVNCTPREYQF